MIQIEAADIVKIVTGLGSLGGGFAFAKPFATQLFAWHLERARERAAIADGKERAIERIAVQHERTVGVLEAVDKRLDRIDARLDRIEAHHGISPTPSAIPSPPPSRETPRRQLTDPDMQVVPRSADATIPPVSTNAR